MYVIEAKGIRDFLGHRLGPICKSGIGLVVAIPACQVKNRILITVSLGNITIAEGCRGACTGGILPFCFRWQSVNTFAIEVELSNKHLYFRTFSGGAFHHLCHWARSNYANQGGKENLTIAPH